ncbi:MAG: FtsX-like permease family protein [Oscillibacter sp.]|uniref:ABC transporter permease n=1 Tax=uncultured Oscillibacter sp. TaxID=876091 RepID=UPI00216C0CCF|nr:ABC transporter permease [uncultured Oscillibacter sp.]MCI9644654.1 FtsX-like permease family protein [Oscillibacter sp.]
MNIRQAVKMAWKSIWGKKGRAVLTMLGIIIGIASVMTIVSVITGYASKMMEQFEAMGTNRIQVSVYSNVWTQDENGEMVPAGKDYFPDVYEYCSGMKDLVVGVTPQAYFSATMVYGTKTTANMEYQWDESGMNLISAPPEFYYGSDQYSACSNLTITKGRDLSYLDIQKYNQVVVLGAQAAKIFFGTANPVGETVQLNGQNFEVIGVYASRIKEGSTSMSTLDNFVLVPYTCKRVLGGEQGSDTFIVVAKDPTQMDAIVTQLDGFLKGLLNQGTNDYNVRPENQNMDYVTESLNLIGGVLAGVAAISLMVGGIGIMNIMLVTVTERTREIGIRRAIGAQRSSIVTQFLIEAAMLCGIGGIIGIGIGTLGCFILGNILFQMTIYPSAMVTAGAFGLSVLLGVVFGCYPAIKASNLQPVEALRAE